MGNIGVQRRLWHGARVSRTRATRLFKGVEASRLEASQRSQWVLAGDKAQEWFASQQFSLPSTDMCYTRGCDADLLVGGHWLGCFSISTKEA